MEFDWLNPSFEFDEIVNPRQVEESFEDPFSLRILPDSPRFARQGRYLCLGKSLNGKHFFSVYRSNGKLMRVLICRIMTEAEQYFYERKAQQALNS